MSWQAYVDTNLVATGHVCKASIHGHDGSSWATSPDFAAFSDASGIRANGLFINGEKYITLNAGDRSIYGKKGAGGVICVKTKKAVLIALYNDKTQPGEATKVVEALADYLISVSY